MIGGRLTQTGWAVRALAHRLGQAVVDAALVLAAYWLAFQLRFDWEITHKFTKVFDATWPIVVGVTLLVFLGFRFYTKWWRFTNLRDLQAIVMACVMSGLIVTTLFSLWRPEHAAAIPRGVLVTHPLLLIVLVGGARFLVRSIIERPGRARLVASGKRALICGAGDAGVTLVREMLRHRSFGYSPVGLIDDDPRKRGMRVMGVKTRGTRQDLPHLLREQRVDEVIIAMPSAPGTVRREIAEMCRKAGVRCTTLPSLPELINGDVTVRQLRQVQVEDVLGRAPVEIDLAKVARYLNGKTVMVTGAGGSIGSELCRQVAQLGARRLVMIDHAENNLFQIDLELRERGFTNLVPVIGDCKDEPSMTRAFEEHRPAIVFHAAAYKHVPMMELNPLQAVANNTLATELMANLAEQFGVERFCLVSTDKAVEPKTVMGACKALAERVIEERTASSSRTRFAAVRFGNVLGSSGSVLPIFRRQIAAGGPVTVTHAEMTRFFMTIPEAVQLIIEATGIAEGGDIFVLDMGEPVRILDLAHRMIELSGHEPGRDIQVEIVGIRPGEKLHEELFNVDEEVRPTRYGKVMRATRQPLPPALLHDGLRDLRRRVGNRNEVGLNAALATTLGIGRDGLVDSETTIAPPRVPGGQPT